ncbi:MAG: thiamine-phosphate synthase family protein [Thermoproteota archaeon]
MPARARVSYFGSLDASGLLGATSAAVVYELHAVPASFEVVEVVDCSTLPCRRAADSAATRRISEAGAAEGVVHLSPTCTAKWLGQVSSVLARHDGWVVLDLYTAYKACSQNPLELLEEAERALAGISGRLAVVYSEGLGGELEEQAALRLPVAERMGRVSVGIAAGDSGTAFADVPGCSEVVGHLLASSLAALLASGASPRQAADEAARYTSAALIYGERCRPRLAAPLEADALRWRVLDRVKRAVDMLLALEGLEEVIPEVGMNVAEALPKPYARGPGDVAAVDGRIVRTLRGAKPSGCVEFGASSHLARLVVSIGQQVEGVRAVVNLRYSEQVVEAARRAGLRTMFVDRRAEPEQLRAREGGTMEWIASLAASGGEVPDVIYDVGDVGKEPMVRVVGRDALEVAGKVERILAELSLLRRGSTQRGS